MQLHDAQGKRLYLTADERVAFLAAAAKAARPVRTLCGVLHTTGCRISEALVLTPEHVDLPGKAVVFETLKKRRPEPLEIDIARQVRDITRGVPHRAAAMGPEFVLATEIDGNANCGVRLGFRESMRLLKNLHALHMTPLARARACGRWPWRDADVGGGDDAA